MHIDAPPERVYEILLDGWRYADWVAGAKRIRAVDANWPEPGSRFHHKVGVGPFKIKDTTKLLEAERPSHVRLEARARPAGVVVVDIRIEPEDGGSRVKLVEYPVRGVAKVFHNRIQDAMIHGRNVESLRRLKKLAESNDRDDAGR